MFIMTSKAACSKFITWLGEFRFAQLEKEFRDSYPDLDPGVYFPMWLKKEKSLPAEAQVVHYESLLRQVESMPDDQIIKPDTRYVVKSEGFGSYKINGTANFFYLDHPKAAEVLDMPLGLYVFWKNKDLTIQKRRLSKIDAHVIDLIQEGELSDLDSSLDFLMALAQMQDQGLVIKTT